VDKDALAGWALANGWRMIAGHPSLTKPSSPKEAIVRMVFKVTIVSLGLGLDTIPGSAMLMRENKDRMVFAGMAGAPSPKP
jgi:hypothetical protein